MHQRSPGVLLLVLLSALMAPAASGPIVSTTAGSVEGQRLIHNLRTYEEFLGIPFAAAPVGSLRWEPPQPVTPWSGVLPATTYGLHCTQGIAAFYPLIGMAGDSGEDCLFINVWVPQGVADNGATRRPVMVYIYGGGYQIGTGEMYPGYELALHADVIVVNFNYRVGTLGWMNAGDSGFPGNYGLWDLRAALLWVHDNIAAFSGDASRVTIFGQSAGGSMVSHAVLSPALNHLFTGAIAMSGAAEVQAHPTRLAAILSSIFECSNVVNSTVLKDCLKAQDAQELMFWGSMGPVLYDSGSSAAMPVVDGVMVPMTPADSLLQGEGIHVNFITGSTYDDAAGTVLGNLLGLPLPRDHNWAATNESLISTLTSLLGGTSNPDELVADILRQYPGMNTEDNYTRTLETSAAMTHWMFGAGCNWEANQRASHSSSNPTYHFQFRHRQSFLHGYPAWVNGSHLDDLYSVFGHPYMEALRQVYLQADFDAVDDDVSDYLMNYYSNFAYTGNPNIGPKPVAALWMEFNPLLQNYMQLSPTFSMQIFDSTTIDNYRYWTEEFPTKMTFPVDPTFPFPEHHENLRSLTEEELSAGVDRVLDWVRNLVNDDESTMSAIISQVDQFVKKRKHRLVSS